jgi:hypothetical protein
VANATAVGENLQTLLKFSANIVRNSNRCGDRAGSSKCVPREGLSDNWIWDDGVAMSDAIWVVAPVNLGHLRAWQVNCENLLRRRKRITGCLWVDSSTWCAHDNCERFCRYDVSLTETNSGFTDSIAQLHPPESPSFI